MSFPDYYKFPPDIQLGRLLFTMDIDFFILHVKKVLSGATAPPS